MSPSVTLCQASLSTINKIIIIYRNIMSYDRLFIRKRCFVLENIISNIFLFHVSVGIMLNACLRMLTANPDIGLVASFSSSSLLLIAGIDDDNGCQ